MELVSIGREPGTESAADKLSDHIRNLMNIALKRVAYADGKPLDNIPDPDDGIMRIAD